jgi:hypothetical protein
MISRLEEEDPQERSLTVIGKMDVTNKQFDLVEMRWMTENQMRVHLLNQLFNLQLQGSDEDMDEAVGIFLEENQYQSSQKEKAEECFTVAYALQTLLRAFANIPIAILGRRVHVDEQTDMAVVMAPLLKTLNCRRKKAKK